MYICIAKSALLRTKSFSLFLNQLYSFSFLEYIYWLQSPTDLIIHYFITDYNEVFKILPSYILNQITSKLKFEEPAYIKINTAILIHTYLLHYHYLNTYIDYWNGFCRFIRVFCKYLKLIFNIIAQNNFIAKLN